jgi:hypothetical protein
MVVDDVCVTIGVAERLLAPLECALDVGVAGGHDVVVLDATILTTVEEINLLDSTAVAMLVGEL